MAKKKSPLLPTKNINLNGDWGGKTIGVIYNNQSFE